MSRDEDGSLIIFTLFIMVAMLMCVGVGIDTMRHEMYRTRMQEVADRAALAAANLDETRSAETVAADYWTRAGFPQGAATFSANEGLNAREVDVRAAIEINTMLLGLVGNETLDVMIGSRAMEVRNEVEVSLVLDYSMSMIANQKYQRLQAAASSFVDTMYANDNEGGTSMNFVPYAGTVSAGRDLFALLGGNRAWDRGSCLEMDVTDFSRSGLPTGTTQVPHFEKYYNANDPNSVFGWCQPDENQVRAAMNNPEQLKSYIMNSKMSGGTGTDIAMKWGLALLDPASRGTLESLPADQRPAAGRPRNWDEPNTRKVIVLMTDGGITGQIRPIKTGFEDIDADDEDNEQDNDEIDGIDWDAINAVWKIGNQQRNKVGTQNQYTMVRGSDAVRNFYESCDLAKSLGVTIYTIAYNANNNAQNQMRTCASSPALFYNVDLLDIEEAFASIALSISDIRLTN